MTTNAMPFNDNHLMTYALHVQMSTTTWRISTFNV